MQIVNGVQYLNITFLLALFASASVTAVFGTVLVPLFMHHYSHIN